jgi:hypothetical protein
VRLGRDRPPNGSPRRASTHNRPPDFDIDLNQTVELTIDRAVRREAEDTFCGTLLRNTMREVLRNLQKGTRTGFGFWPDNLLTPSWHPLHCEGKLEASC